jgi:hypothetical protein
MNEPMRHKTIYVLADHSGSLAAISLDITGNLSDLLIFVVRDSDVSRHTNRHQHHTPYDANVLHSDHS